ncbi:MAG: hypothetical protein WCT01_02755 [Candidatus Shapirobacteria bacterium]
MATHISNVELGRNLMGSDCLKTCTIPSQIVHHYRDTLGLTDDNGVRLSYTDNNGTGSGFVVETLKGASNRVVFELNPYAEQRCGACRGLAPRTKGPRMTFTEDPDDSGNIAVSYTGGVPSFKERAMNAIKKFQARVLNRANGRTGDN